MKLSGRVPAIQVKRAFVASDYISKHGVKRYVSIESRKKFNEKAKRAKAYVHGKTNADLDRIIAKGYSTRRDAYNSVRWYIGTVSTREVAVWRSAGGLPAAWTKGSLAETGMKVNAAIKNKSKLLRKRAKKAIPNILTTSIHAIQNDKFFLPIVLPAGMIKPCRLGVKKFKGDVDDGCMRAIALAVSGKKAIRVYIGKSIKN